MRKNTKMELMSFRPEQESRWYKNQDVIFPLLLVVLGVLFFADPLFSSKNFYFRDVLNFHLPLRKVMIDSYAQGEFPLWNPRVYLGQPMLANPNYMAVYPTILLHIIFPFAYAFKLHLILHALMAGTGAFLLQRQMGITPLAAFAGSAAYQFSGTVISMLNLYNIAPCVALLPWIAWSFLRCLKSISRGRILVFGSLLSLQLILMEPLMIQCIFWLLLAIALVYLLEASSRGEAFKIVLKVGIWGAAFAIGLAAVQILPSLELLRHSVRGGGYDGVVLGYWSMHPADLFNTFIPNLFGSLYTFKGEMYWGEKFHYAREGYLISLYLGISTLLLALCSWFSSRKALTVVIAATAAIGTVLSLGQFAYAYLWLGRWLPFFRFGRYPVKYMLLSSLALCILASLGFDAVRNPQSAFGRHGYRLVCVLLMGLIAGILCLGLSVYIPVHSADVRSAISSWLTPDQLKFKDLAGIEVQLVKSLKWAGAFGLITVLLLIAARFWKNTSVITSLIALAVVSELSAQNLRLSPLMSGADFEYISDVIKYLRPAEGSEIHRVYHVEPVGFFPVGHIWAPNRSVAWLYLFIRRSGEPLFGIVNGIQYSISRSIDDLNTKESNNIFRKGNQLDAESFLTLLGRLDSTILLTFGEMDSPRVSLSQSFSAGSQSKLNVYRFKDYFPRAYFVSNVQYSHSPEQALESLLDPKFPYKSTVILEGPGTSGIKNDIGGQVRVLNYENASIRCEVESHSQGHVVLLDSYYPGWRATVDGTPVPIERANYAFRAVQVPSGKHLIEFRYRPVSFYLGFLASGLTLILGAVLWFSEFRSRR